MNHELSIDMVDMGLDVFICVILFWYTMIHHQINDMEAPVISISARGECITFQQLSSEQKGS